MWYKKPANVSYTDMAIYIDNNIHNKDRNDELIFEYMWHLFYILAVKRRFFNTDRDYNEYALYGATRLYMRYKKEEEKKSKRIKPIKSCLNYIKKVLYPIKVDYQQAYYEQVVRDDVAKDEALYQLKEDKADGVRRAMHPLVQVEYSQYIEGICKTVKFAISDIPYKNDKAMMHNIYISCLLTLLKMVTISNKNKERIAVRLKRALSIDNLVEDIYKEERQEGAVLYHLDSSMGNYILTLVVRIKKEIVKDLRDIVGYYEPSEQVIKDVLMSPMEEYLHE